MTSSRLSCSEAEAAKPTKRRTVTTCQSHCLFGIRFVPVRLALSLEQLQPMVELGRVPPQSILGGTCWIFQCFPWPTQGFDRPLACQDQSREGIHFVQDVTDRTGLNSLQDYLCRDFLPGNQLLSLSSETLTRVAMCKGDTNALIFARVWKTRCHTRCKRCANFQRPLISCDNPGLQQCKRKTKRRPSTEPV